MEILRQCKSELIFTIVVLSIVMYATLIAQPGAVMFAINIPGWAFIQLVDSVSWDWTKTVGMTLFSWMFWSVAGIAIISIIKRRIGFAVTAVGLFIICGYYLGFRTTCYETNHRSICIYRSWGSITRGMTVEQSGKFETWWKWYPPYTGTHTGEMIRSRSDRNADGQWDTWIDSEAGTLDIDIDGDQLPDHTLSRDYEGFKQARAIRGY